MSKFDGVDIKKFRPPLYSIHIFHYSNEKVFKKNGIIYVRCYGEEIDLKEVDQSI